MSGTAPTAPGEGVYRPTSDHALHPLLAISATLDESRSVDLKPVYVSLGLEPSAFTEEFRGHAGDPTKPQAKAVFDAAVRGSAKYADRIWLFKGGSYFRYYEKPDGDAIDGPLPLSSDNWHGFPPAFASGIDTVLRGTANYEGKLWFFKGTDYLRYDLASDAVEFPPRPIVDNWPGIPREFVGNGLDAAVHGMGAYYGVCWFFKGPQYLRYNFKTDRVEHGPAPIVGNWGKWPAAFADGVDFALYGTGAEAEKLRFVRGDQCLVYDLKADAVEAGPAPITDFWPEFRRFLPKPQLFMVEKYSLRTFFGEMGRGPVCGMQVTVPTNTYVETYIVTRKEETSASRSSTNILESQSEQAADALSRTISDDQSKSGSKEDYGYDMDASFHGDASMTSLSGGEANAHLSVRGGSQDTRSAFATSVSKQIGVQASETHDLHKQQTRMVDSSAQINQQTESGFKQIIDNRGNPSPVNVGLFQITQEYIIVLSLVDAQVAFRNGNPRQALTASIHDMPNLLAKCVMPELRAPVAAAIIDAFENVEDHTKKTRSLLLPAESTPDSPRRVDGDLKSTYEVLDSTGKPMRQIVVPGIIVKVDRPVVLTDNTALANVAVPNG